MRTIHKACSVAILAMMCAACGSGKDAEEPKPMDPKDTFAGDQIRAKERAESVEATTMEHKAEMDRALDEAGQ
jgi:rRNA maturation protein Nop10